VVFSFCILSRGEMRCTSTIKSPKPKSYRSKCEIGNQGIPTSALNFRARFSTCILQMMRCKVTCNCPPVKVLWKDLSKQDDLPQFISACYSQSFCGLGDHHASCEVKKRNFSRSSASPNFPHQDRTNMSLKLPKSSGLFKDGYKSLKGTDEGTYPISNDHQFSF